MLPVAVALAEAGHEIRLAIMGHDLDIAEDPRLGLLPARTRVWNLRPPFARQKCALYLRGVSCLAMDWAKRNQHVTGILTDLARRRDIPSVALPHGIDHVADASYYTDRLDANTFGHFDHIVTPNDIRREILTAAGTPPNRLHVLGSARFTRHWSDKLCTAYPAVPDTDDGRLKIIHFDTMIPQRYEPTLSALRKISALSFANLAIQPKPSAVEEKSPAALPSLFPERIVTNHASQLCQWANVVTGTSSSVIFEAMVRGCELIWLKYLDPDPLALEDLKACRVVNSDAELIDLLSRMHQGRAQNRPDPDAFMKQFLHAGQTDDDVASRYVRFFESVASGTANDQATVAA